MSMPVWRPEDMYRAFVAAFNAGDLDALIALYEPDAVLIPEPGRPVGGHAAIREALQGFLALRGTMTIQPIAIFPTGDLALTHGRWTLSATSPDGRPLTLGGKAAEVLRRQPDGTWLHAIDNPYGTG
jgi:uncharacterized protein (TIGR02246 family)